MLWREEFNIDDDDPAWTDDSSFVSIYVVPLDLDIDMIYSFSTRILSKCSDRYQTNVSSMISLRYVYISPIYDDEPFHTHESAHCSRPINNSSSVHQSGPVHRPSSYKRSIIYYLQPHTKYFHAFSG